jgi:MFS transporter, DHA2 family, multidrug resistance protein
LLMFGLAMFALSMWNFSPLTDDWGAGELLLPQLIRGFAQSFTVGPTVNLTLGGLAPARLKFASGLFNLMRNLGGAIGIAVCATILNNRTNLHFFRLAEHLNSSNRALSDLLQRTGSSFAASHPGANAAGPLQQLWAATMREAQTQSFSDIYLVIMVCFVVAAVMVPLMRKIAAAKVPSGEAH